MRRPRNTALLVALVIVGGVGCGSSGKSGSGKGAKGSSAAGTAKALPGKGKPTIRIGDKNFPEQYVLGELYSQALRAKGYTTTLESDIGASEITDKALTSGQIDMYPEYTGVIATVLAGTDAASAPDSAQATYLLAKQYEARRGYTAYDPTPLADAAGLASKRSYAERHKLKTASDLKKLASFVFGGPPEDRTRFEGVPGLRQVYGLKNLKFKSLSIARRYAALDAGKVDVVSVFTTDGELQSRNKYTVLPDTKGIFGYQNVTPVVRTSLARKLGPAFPDILDAVSAKLTNAAMQEMNAEVQIEHRKPATVARAFLRDHGLL